MHDMMARQGEVELLCKTIVYNCKVHKPNIIITTMILIITKDEKLPDLTQKAFFCGTFRGF